jgi:hypothetical protein
MHAEKNAKPPSPVFNDKNCVFGNEHPRFFINVFSINEKTCAIVFVIIALGGGGTGNFGAARASGL